MSQHHHGRHAWSHPDPLPVTLAEARGIADEERMWTCLTCDTMIPPDNHDIYCRSCRDYWNDLANGAFDDDDPPDGPLRDRCPGHEWAYTGTAYGGDDERWGGEGRAYCIHCGADGDA
jgi:hypothetical protein